MSQGSTSLTYADSGVDIDAGNALVDAIKPIVKQTLRPEVLGGLGGFGGLFELPAGYQQPVLVSATDGVGTKLALAQQFNQHQTIGIDLVAMCVNDLIVQGAEPLYFLDYYATGRLNVACATEVIAGIAAGCLQAKCSLIGGETAEMPGMYQGEDYDLAGFAVGIVEKSQIITGSTITPGDQLIALASSGPHANGYSLIRKILSHQQVDPQTTELDGQPLLTSLLTPTQIYVDLVLSLLKKQSLQGIVHITGGGFTENIPRILPQHCAVDIHLDSWKKPAIFDWLQQQGQVSDAEMLRTFNCGVGMVLVVSADKVDSTMQQLAQQAIPHWSLGQVIEKRDQSAVVYS